MVVRELLWAVVCMTRSVAVVGWAVVVRLFGARQVKAVVKQFGGDWVSMGLVPVGGRHSFGRYRGSE